MERIIERPGPPQIIRVKLWILGLICTLQALIIKFYDRFSFYHPGCPHGKLTLVYNSIMARFSSPNLQPFRFSKTTLGTSTKASFKIPKISFKISVINALTAWEGLDLYCPFPSPVLAFDGGPSNLLSTPQRTSSSRLQPFPVALPGVVLYSSLLRTTIVPASQDGNNYHSGLTGT